MQRVVCSGCQRVYEPGRVARCLVCRFPLGIEYDYDRVPRSAFDPNSGGREEGIWKHRQLLPISPAASVVTLGEGNTPLLECRKMGNRLGLSSLWIKDETRQPTGSFKDRPLSVAVSKAREFGAEVVVTASSGNAAASMAAYAARAGLRSVVLIPVDTPRSKLLQIVGTGARVVQVEGAYSESARLAAVAAEALGWYDVSTTFANPYSVEGNKTAAYEIAAALHWEAPEWITVPVGSGPLLVGMWKGFKEMRHAGLISGLPRMIAAQASGCAPIALAFSRQEETVRQWETPRTVASGIRDALAGYAEDGTLTLRTVRDSEGQAVAASDDEILQAAAALGESEGLYVEPTVGAALAAVAQLTALGIVAKFDRVVVMATGHGLKQSFVTDDTLGRLPQISPTLEDLRRLY